MTGPPESAVLLLAAASLAWPSSRSRGADRVRSLVPRPPRRRRPGPAAAPAAAHRRVLLAVVVGAALVLLIGGLPGLVAGAVAAGGGDRLLRRAGQQGPGSAAVRHGLPAACDLLSVVLASGMPVGPALAAVAGAVEAPLSGALGSVAGSYRLGAEPRRAWAGAPEELGALGRVLVRAGESGSSVAAALRALAADGRAAERARVEAGVRRAGVWVLAPLGLCFLPAFVCLGVVPLVLGIAGQVFR